MKVEIPQGYLQLSEWCRRYGVSRQWGSALAAEGRLEGAKKLRDWYWVVPENTQAPARKANEYLERLKAVREARVEEERVFRAKLGAIRGQHTVEMRQAREDALPEAMKAQIGQLIARDWLLCDGSGGRWMDMDSQMHAPLEGWNAACEAYYASVKR